MTIGSLFEQSIAAEFPHEFTPHQREAVSAIGSFLADPRNDQAFVLRGYAGTGKTSLVSAVVRVWRKLQRPVVLLAPTGRKVRRASTARLPLHAPAVRSIRARHREDRQTPDRSARCSSQ